MIETEIRNFLVPSSSAIPAIGSRLYITNLPDVVTYPAVAMYQISRAELDEAEVYVERFQFSVIANTLSSAASITDTIKGLLKSFTGKYSTTSTFTVMSSYPETVTTTYDANISKHIRTLDMLITYRR